MLINHVLRIFFISLALPRAAAERGRSSPSEENQRPEEGPSLTPTPKHSSRSPWGPPVTTRRACHTAFQFHRQMVGGALAWTEHMIPEKPTDTWDPTTSQRPGPSGHLKRSPGTSREPQVQGKVFKSKAPFLLPPEPKIYQKAGPHTGSLTPTQLPSGGIHGNWTLKCCLLRCLLLGLRGLCLVLLEPSTAIVGKHYDLLIPKSTLYSF